MKFPVISRGEQRRGEEMVSYKEKEEEVKSRESKSELKDAFASCAI